MYGFFYAVLTLLCIAILTAIVAYIFFNRDILVSDMASCFTASAKTESILLATVRTINCIAEVRGYYSSLVPFLIDLIVRTAIQANEGPIQG